MEFVPKRTAIYVLQTNGLGYKNSVNRIFDDKLTGPEPVEKDKHYKRTDDGNFLWSQKGIVRIALDMKENSSIKRNKSRLAWMEAVCEVVEECFEYEIKRLDNEDLRIRRAINAAKRAANKTCQVSGKRKGIGVDLELVGHHLFDKKTRPDLADLHENILIMTKEIHKDFHSWKTGPCEPKDFLDYLSHARFEPKNYYKLVARLEVLQRNYKNQNLKYR